MMDVVGRVAYRSVMALIACAVFVVKLALRISQDLCLLPSKAASTLLSGTSNFETYTAMDHLALNVSEPATEWFNMGDWENAHDLATASENLAQKLYKAADIQTGAAILDVGCGCGDSLLLLARKYNPRLLHGVTSIRSHADRARTRIEKVYVGKEGTAEVFVYCHDAVAFVESRAEQGREPLYDYIFALDCAYHFHTRARFIAAANQLLAPGGTMALIDLVAAHPYPVYKTKATPEWFTESAALPPPTAATPSWRPWMKLCFLTTVAGAHLDSCHAYHDDLVQGGFRNVRITDISASIFPGFARWLTQLGTARERAWRGGGVLQLIALRSFGHGFVRTWAQGGDVGIVRSVLVTARKPKLYS